MRLLRFFDLRLFVLLPGLWLLLGNYTPQLLMHLDRELFFTALHLSPAIIPATKIDVLEFSPAPMQQLQDDPANAVDFSSVIDHLAHTDVHVGILVSQLPRQLPSAAERLIQNTEEQSGIYQRWQEQQKIHQKILRWLTSSNVTVGSQSIPARVSSADQISVSDTSWRDYYAWLPSWLALPQPPIISHQMMSTASTEPRVWPADIKQLARNFSDNSINTVSNIPSNTAHDTLLNGDLSQPLLWQDGENFYPGMALAILRRAPGGENFLWSHGTRLAINGTGEIHSVSVDGSILPAFQTQTNLTTNHSSGIARYNLPQYLQEQNPSSLLLIGAQADPALEQLAGLIQSLQVNSYYHSPWWFYGAEKMVVFVLLVFLLWLLPRMSYGVALLSTALLLLLFVITQMGMQITQLQWLPLGKAIQYCLFGYLVMTLWRQQQRPQRELLARHQEVAYQLSQHLLQQGQLEQALGALDHCTTSNNVLQLMYDIGGQHERKRRIGDALKTYRTLEKRQRKFRDIGKRIKHLTQKQQNPIEDKDLTLTKTIALADPHSRPQFGRYNIERELGRGAMGVVYLGHDPHIARRVAIKTLDYSRFESSELAAVKARFFREAEAAGRLRHANIVTVYDVGEEHDLAFIAMDYVAGQPLSNFINSTQLLPIPQVYRIIAGVADALAYAHTRQVVHRDIKPGNILYHVDSKKVTVTDFGIARISSETRTQTGEIIGSPLYMSPEQVKGQKVGAASDIFSLGVTFFQLLTGHLPFSGDNIAGLSYQIIHGKHRNIRDLRPQVPASASRIINKALHKDPQNRYGNAAEMARSLNNALKKDF